MRQCSINRVLGKRVSYGTATLEQLKQMKDASKTKNGTDTLHWGVKAGRYGYFHFWINVGGSQNCDPSLTHAIPEHNCKFLQNKVSLA